MSNNATQSLSLLAGLYLLAAAACTGGGATGSAGAGGSTGVADGPGQGGSFGGSLAGSTQTSAGSGGSALVAGHNGGSGAPSGGGNFARGGESGSGALGGGGGNFARGGESGSEAAGRVGTAGAGGRSESTTVGLYRTFERSIQNDGTYANKFASVELEVTYTAPSGRKIDFSGFFDGDGNGTGNAKEGNVWKLRFMPDELGTWTYEWSWSDATPGGMGTFATVQEGAGKGILRAYRENPRWFAYNGTEPVWLKSYYETGHGSIAQPFDWIATNVYQPMIDRGYNHLQVNWLLSLCCFDQYYTDGPPQSTTRLALYEQGKASSTMNLSVWQMMERHVIWLNERNVGLHMFLGFDGGRNDGPSWAGLNEAEKDFYVRYVVARLAPYANIAGWNFVWEVSGDRESHELGLARMLQKYDVFDHLRTYEDEMPRTHEYRRPEYTFAAIENHGMFSNDRDSDRAHWKEAWTHHEACLAGYVTGKPVYMSEGNALWRRYWQAKTGATQDDLRQSAWGCATAGASFCWNGHASETNLRALGKDGLPFHGDDNTYKKSADELDTLARVMTEEVAFHSMTPQDALLSQHDPKKVWSLAEPGKQYLVFASNGAPFTLRVAPGRYAKHLWIDAKTGQSQPVPALAATAEEPLSFRPPNTQTDWALVLRL